MELRGPASGVQGGPVDQFLGAAVERAVLDQFEVEVSAAARVRLDFPISVEGAVMSGRAGALGLFRRPGVSDWQAVGDALDRVQMTNLRTRPVLVARALALRPRILLLDEPSTGLDMPTQELLVDLFADLAVEGTALLMTTHDLLVAIESCTRLALLQGTVVADGAPADLRDAEPWMRTFGVSEGSPLLKLVAAA